MHRFGQMWQALIESGNRFQPTDSQKRSNRLVNVFYVYFWLFLIITGLFHLLLMKHAFHGTYSRCNEAFPEAYPICAGFSNVGFGAALLLAVLFLLKNYWGLSRLANTFSFLIAAAYLLLFSSLYPRDTGLSYLSLVLLLLPFSLWNLQAKWLSILELGMVVLLLGILSPFFSAYPAPFEIATGYQNVFALAVPMFLFCVFASVIFTLLKRLNRAERQFITEQKLRERLITDIIPALEQSEKRYSHLVEDVPDIVFSLSENFLVKTVNKTVRKVLQYDMAQLIGQPLMSIVYSDGEAELDRQILLENLNLVLTNKDHVDFRLNLKGKHQPEPLPMRISLSYSESEGHREILGKASPLSEDKMSKFLAREHAEYILDNSLVNAESLSIQLTRNLHTRMEKADITSLRVALREMLINAVEHGNLNITFEEKTRSQMEGRYLDFLKERQADTAYNARRVRVEYVLKNYMVAFRITDEGSGFDFEKFIQTDQEAFNEAGLQHGRGILMTRHVFDRIQYFTPGNRVILAKRFSKA